MRIWEMKNLGALPIKVGEISLTWKSDSEVCSPFIGKEGGIVFPAQPQAEIFLLDNEQFLYKLPDYPGSCWYGGNDAGKTFVYRLEIDAFDIFASSGEGGFFGALFPPLLAEVSRKLRFKGTNTDRYGYIFGLSLPFSWDIVSTIGLMFNANREVFETEGYPFHKASVKGKIVNIGDDVLLAEGMLTMPGHFFKLEGVHLIQPMRYFIGLE